MKGLRLPVLFWLIRTIFRGWVELTGGLRRDSLLSSFGKVTIKSVFWKVFLCPLPRLRGAPFLPPRRLCSTFILQTRWSPFTHRSSMCQRGCAAQWPIFGANRLCPYLVVNKNSWRFGNLRYRTTKSSVISFQTPIDFSYLRLVFLSQL